MTDEASFFVYGTPVPQGSMKAFVVGGHARLTSDNQKLKPWREAVKAAAIEAKQQRNGHTFDTPLVTHFVFYVPRPKSYPKKILFPWRKPDLDKLVRGVNDALTEASFWTDDALVVDAYAAKRFATVEEHPMGCWISVGEFNG